MANVGQYAEVSFRGLFSLSSHPGLMLSQLPTAQTPAHGPRKGVMSPPVPRSSHVLS